MYYSSICHFVSLIMVSILFSHFIFKQCAKHWIEIIFKSYLNDRSPGCWCCNEWNDRLNKKLIIIRVGHIIIPLRPLRPDIKRTLAATRPDPVYVRMFNFNFWILYLRCYLYKVIFIQKMLSYGNFKPIWTS